MQTIIENPPLDLSDVRGELLPYQLRWLEDPAQFKIGLWARQTGKDYTCALEAVLDCLARQTHWLIVAAGERQAVESLEKARAWVERIVERRHGPKAFAEFTCKASEIRFPNDSRITALPAKPQTVRGYSANVILTEFAFHDDPANIWSAVFPSVSNPMNGGVKKLRVITTPNGHGNFFHRLWQDAENFSKHRTTVHEAKAQGLPVDLAALRAGIFDSDAWAQEYECEFLDASHVLLPYDLIESCESPEATETSTPELLSTAQGELFAGIDFGRKRDLTVCWLLEALPHPNSTFTPGPTRLLRTREVLVLEKTPTPAQLAALRPRVARARYTCVDYTGAGIGLGDLLAHEFGAATPPPKFGPRQLPLFGGKVELCQFTTGLKEELFPTLRAAFESRSLRIPKNLVIRDDLHGVHKVVTQNGQVSYRATQTADGHSDRCTALALALRAAQSVPPRVCAGSVRVTSRGYWGPSRHSRIGRVL